MPPPVNMGGRPHPMAAVVSAIDLPSAAAYVFPCTATKHS